MQTLPIFRCLTGPDIRSDSPPILPQPRCSQSSAQLAGGREGCQCGQEFRLGGTVADHRGWGLEEIHAYVLTLLIILLVSPFLQGDQCPTGMHNSWLRVALSVHSLACVT